jgi:hypothetical protein
MNMAFMQAYQGKRKMTKEIPTKLKELLTQVKMTEKQATWDCHGTFVVLHKALERIAAHKNIVFDQPTIIASDVTAKQAVMLVTGHMGEATEWSIGEAAPYNNKNGYPFAMAEKRAKDRVILKLVGLHGEVYSQDEAEDFNLTQSLAELEPEKRRSIEKWRKGFSFCDRQIALDEAIEQWRTWRDKYDIPSDVCQYVENVIDEKQIELGIQI